MVAPLYKMVSIFTLVFTVVCLCSFTILVGEWTGNGRIVNVIP